MAAAGWAGPGEGEEDGAGEGAGGVLLLNFEIEVGQKRHTRNERVTFRLSTLRRRNVKLSDLLLGTRPTSPMGYLFIHSGMLCKNGSFHLS